uniref:Major facilitator superfamily associated domain-containing protein n=1 Tax=Amphimedon queenslandica TaxID=400682 RepID=A0A1X7TE63_AMPQE
MVCPSCLSSVKRWSCSSFPVILVLSWDFLMYIHILFFRYFEFTSFLSEKTSNRESYTEIGLGVLYYVFFLLFPFFALVSDVWIVRKRIIMAGALLCFSSFIIGGAGYILNSCYYSQVTFWLTKVTVTFLEVIGYGVFKANIVQYNIDQLVGASSSLLDTVIYWHSASVPIILASFLIIRCLMKNHEYFVSLAYIVSGVSVSLVLASHSFFKHKLENVSLIKNPVKLIIGVLCYARKHKYPENRSALTYWEEEAPSRLDLGKEFYGGPFTEEEVDDVKTFFRMVPLLISAVGYSCNAEIYKWIMYGYNNDDNSFYDCIMTTQLFSPVSFVGVFLVYFILFKLISVCYAPGMLRLISVGLLFSFASLVSKMAVFIYYEKDGVSNLPFISPVLLVPQLLEGVAFLFIFPVSLEFIIAQTPGHMKGMMIGMWLASVGIGSIININLKYPFGCHNVYLCTSYYYYLTKAVLVLMILVAYIVLTKWYKYRIRDNGPKHRPLNSIDVRYQDPAIEQEDED